jgi:group I intron endonuclease
MKETENKYLVYKVFNEETGRIYIGATTDSLHQRKLDHTERANRGEPNKFHVAISTYGADSFSWEQVDTANSIDELAKKEQSYIVKYNTKEEGYNSSIGGEFKKTVYQYDLKDGCLISKYDCLQNAANVISATKKAISKACLSVNQTYGGYFWSYDYKEPFKPNKDVRKKKVLYYNLVEDTVNDFDSVADASRKTGVSKSCIARFCRSERKPPEGIMWKYE